ATQLPCLETEGRACRFLLYKTGTCLLPSPSISCRQSVAADRKFYPNVMGAGVTARYRTYNPLRRRGEQGSRPGRFSGVTFKKERIMKTKTFRLLSIAGIAAGAVAAASPVLAHDGYGHAHYGYPGHRVVVVRPPLFTARPVVVYRPYPV